MNRRVFGIGTAAEGRAGRVLLALAALFPAGAGAQVFFNPGDVVQMGTGGGQALVTRAIDLQAGAADGLPSVFRFEFGFATAESAGAGGLHDGVTVTLTTTSDTPVAVLATADVFGLSLAPTTPGALTVLPGSLTLSAGAPPAGFGTGLASIGAFAVDYLVPPELLGVPLRAYFDLVDNGDAAGSVAYATVPVSAAVPEPGEWMLGTGLLLGGWAGWRRWKMTVSRR